MQTIDFFAEFIYREAPRTDIEYGINDAAHEEDHGGMAYTTTVGKGRWNATVLNPGKIPIVFQPLDNNLEVVENGNDYSLCDGMLFTAAKDEVIFIELKDKRKDWVAKSVSQLKSTIGLFAFNHNIERIQKREAYAANKMQPQFMFSQRTLMQKFYNDTRFRLHVEARVLVK